MALTRTVGQLVGLCQRRADQEPAAGESGDQQHVDTSEWKELISEVYGQLHGAVSEAGARYFETEATITATGAASYALPADHLSTVGVDYVVDSAGRRSELAELAMQERGTFVGLTGTATMFAFSGANIVLYPLPSSGSYKHLYIPQPTDYSSAGNGTTVDLINNDGLRFVVWGVASIAMHKGSDNQQRALLERDDAREKITDWAINRALTMPKRRVVSAVDALPVDPGSWIFYR